MNWLSKRIKGIIAEKEIKKQTVAKKLGLSPSKFSDLLNGRRIIRGSDIIAICEALDISPNELFEYKKGA